MDELTQITRTRTGFTVITGYEVVLAENTDRAGALRALFHRGFTPVAAVTAVNAAARLGRFAVVGLVAG